MDTEKEPIRRKRRDLTSRALPKYHLRNWRQTFYRTVDSKILKIKDEKSPKMKKRLCRYFNYWMDDRRDAFMNFRNQYRLLGSINNLWAENQECVVNKLKSSISDSCKRKENKDKKVIRDKKKVIEDFCEDKEEHLQELNENITEEKCTNYNNWLDEKKKFFVNKNWINEQEMTFDENLEISENCTLNDMNTFVTSLDCIRINKKENDSCDSKISENCNQSQLLTPDSSFANASDHSSSETITIKPNATTNLSTTTINSTTKIITQNTANPSNESTTPTPGSTQKLTSTIASIHSDPNSPIPLPLKASVSEIPQTDVSPTTPTTSSTPKVASTNMSTHSDEDSPIALPVKAMNPTEKPVTNDIILTSGNNVELPTVSDSSESSISHTFRSTNADISGNSQIELSPTTPTSALNITLPSNAIPINIPTNIQAPITNSTSSSSNTTLNIPPISPTSAKVNETQLETIFETTASSGNTSTPTSTIMTANISTNLSITSHANTNSSTDLFTLTPTNSSISTTQSTIPSTILTSETKLQTKNMSSHVDKSTNTTGFTLAVSTNTTKTISSTMVYNSPLITNKSTFNSSVNTSLTNTSYYVNGNHSNDNIQNIASNNTLTVTPLPVQNATANVTSNNILTTTPIPTQNTTTNVTTDNPNTPICTSNIPVLIALSLGASLLLIIFLFAILYKHRRTRFLPGKGSKKKKKYTKRKNYKESSISYIKTPLDIPYELLESNIQLNNVCNKTNNSLCKVVFENEIDNTLKEKSEENAINIKTKSDIAIIREKLKWKIMTEIYTIVIDECKKEEWKKDRKVFFDICLEELKNEGMYLDITLENEKKDNVTIMLEKKKLLWKQYKKEHGKILEKWKKEKWFENLKREWKEEEVNYSEIIKQERIIKSRENDLNNPSMKKQKIIWRNWVKKHITWLHDSDDQKWFNELLEIYKIEEEIKENIEGEDSEEGYIKIEREEKSDKDSKKNNLKLKLWIDVHMMILKECKREERMIIKNEFLKTCIEELKTTINPEEILETQKEITGNIILENKKEVLEKLKRENWFIELKIDWNSKEKKYMEELIKKNLPQNNEERIKNFMINEQKIIWKKYWEEINKKWIENESMEKWLINLIEENVNDNKNKVKIKEIKDELEEYKEKTNTSKEGRKEEEKKMKDEEIQIKNKKNFFTLKKKPKWKTMIEIQMIIMEDCKQKEWELNREKFLKICLDEWKGDERLYGNIVAKKSRMNTEESIIIALERQKTFSRKLIERHKKMIEKWRKEEWFNSLMEEWIKEVNIHVETLDEKKSIEGTNNIENNITLEKKNEIWSQWIKKQRRLFTQYEKESLFNRLLDEYNEEEDMYEREDEQTKEKKNNIDNMERDPKTDNIKDEVSEEIEKINLISELWIEIHMLILDQCKKEEIEYMKKEFLKTYIEGKNCYKELDEHEITKKEINEEEKEGIINDMIERKKEQWESWKREEWFQEMKLNWHKTGHTNDIEESDILDDTKVGITNFIFERQVFDRQWLEKQRNFLKKWNKQKLKKSMKNQYKDEQIEEENEENVLNDKWDITIL
ncbi:surface-associated interspersed protein (SURFIN) [Plasmodium gallinaceum]|uniref:Surface-associated interspersed protein (SURFIN) n=1 Tax=Plasmodium gallinaceum TaxID=5849 RepID=A0A1J1GSX5_PLAGA|nr:surface-associated interspersed protein (SURFIN) [Plasmodium gallinaceum]CRG94408.1 surface-associated interspersed protein (SURFIN) [Plasmodium gallinaceum]